MSNVQLVNRMLSLESTVDADKIRKGHLDSNDWGKLIEGADSIAKSHLIIDDTFSLTCTFIGTTSADNNSTSNKTK